MSVVDEGEPGRFPATVLCTEPKRRDLVFLRLVQLGELGAVFVLGYVGPVGMEDIDYRLLPPKQRIANELAGSQRDLRVRQHDGYFSR